MVARVRIVAFQGIDTVDIDVQVHIASGLPRFTIVGLPDKAVAESRERVRAALASLGLALPPKRLTINLSPSDLAKEGSHFDLPIALGLLAAMGVVAEEDLIGFLALGELALDGKLAAVAGVLPAAIGAARQSPRWPVLGPPRPPDRRTASLRFIPTSPISRARARGGPFRRRRRTQPVGGLPGAGKSMLAARLGRSARPRRLRWRWCAASPGRSATAPSTRPGRSAHHSSSMPALIGGGSQAKPGEVSLAHCRVLFLDELAEFPRPVLDSLRQPIETGRAVISRANRHVTYPARFQLVAAMNPCRCGYLADPARALRRKLSGTLVRPAARPFRPAHQGGGGGDLISARLHARRPSPPASPPPAPAKVPAATACATPVSMGRR